MPEQRDLFFGERIRGGAADIQRAERAVTRDERHAAHGFDVLRFHQRRAGPPAPFQIGPPEHAGGATLKRQAGDRFIQGQHGVGPGEATRLVIHPVEPQLRRLLVVQRDADLIGVDDTLDGFRDRLEQPAIVEMRDEKIVDLEQEAQMIAFFPQLALIALRLVVVDAVVNGDGDRRRDLFHERENVVGVGGGRASCRS